MKNSYKKTEFTQKDYEFMHSLSAAILEQAPSRISKILKLWFVAIVVFLIWASFAKIDEITRGKGKVIPYGQNKVIQNLEGGIIEEILVHEGDPVKKGQILLKINNSKTFSNREANIIKYNELYAKKLR